MGLKFDRRVSMRIQLFLSAILFGCLLEVQSRSFLIETEDAGSKQPDEFVGVRRFWRRRSDDSTDLEDSFAHLLAEELRRRSADGDGDGNDYGLFEDIVGTVNKVLPIIADAAGKVGDALGVPEVKPIADGIAKAADVLANIQLIDLNCKDVFCEKQPTYN